MEVAAGLGHACVTKGGLDKMDRRASVKGMGCMCVAKPVRRHGLLKTRTPCRLTNDPMNR